MDTSNQPQSLPIQISSSVSRKNTFLTVALSLILLISLAGSGFLFLDNQKLRKDLQTEKTTFQTETPQETPSILYGKESGDQHRIGTNPKSEVIPRLFHTFQQKNVLLDPFVCVYGCATSVYQDGIPFNIKDASKLDMYLISEEETNKYYQEILSLFKENLYIAQPEIVYKQIQSETEIRHTDITHPEKDIVCNLESSKLDKTGAYDGRGYLTSPFNITISCASLNEENQKYISLQKAIISDLKLPLDNHLFVDTYTDNFAMVSNLGTCMILKKSNGVWTTLETSGCSDPSWHAKEGRLSTVLNRDYGIPIEEAEVLAN